MGHESLNPDQKRFDLGDLGLLDGVAEREFTIITRTAATLLGARVAMFCVLDDVNASVFVRAIFRPLGADYFPERYPREGSLFGSIIENGRCFKAANLGEKPEWRDSFEATLLPFDSMLATPVHGPARETIGALIVLGEKRSEWSELERMEMKDQAHLISRHILLRASLETLKRLSREREALAHIPRYRN